MRTTVLMAVCGSDRAEHLSLALESIYEKQTVRPDEIVIVCDGRLNDEIYAVIRNFRDTHRHTVKCYSQSKCLGLGTALKNGMPFCTGDFIFRMDADDICDEKRFEKQIKYLTEHPEVDVLGSDIAEFVSSPREAFRVRSCPAEHSDIAHLCRTRNPMNHQTVCIRHAALESCGYESLPLLEDYYLWVRMLSRGFRFANINEPLVFARIGKDFYARRSDRRRIDGWHKLQKYMLEHRMISKKQAMMNMVYIRAFVYMPRRAKKIVYSTFLRK